MELYKNEDRKCECWKCELQEKCVWTIVNKVDTKKENKKEKVKF